MENLLFPFCSLLYPVPSIQYPVPKTLIKEQFPFPPGPKRNREIRLADNGAGLRRLTPYFYCCVLTESTCEVTLVSVISKTIPVCSTA